MSAAVTLNQGGRYHHPTQPVLGLQCGSQPDSEAYRVYIHERGKKPRLTDVQVAGKIPSTITDAGRTFYWAGADISQRTLTYTNIKPGTGA